MNKKLIALAVAGATFAPAVMAQAANPVTLYGRIWVMANSVKASGPNSSPSRITVVDESSLIGFRGTEDLGGGIKAFFQLESNAPPDVGGGAFGNRNSGVGLQGNFGSFLLGRWDSPIKLAQIHVDPYGQNTIGNQLTVVGVSGAGANEFNRRQNNNIQYWTPNFSGFSARFSYGANEGKTQTANPQTTGFSLDYNKGPVRVSYAYENHKDQLGATTTAGTTEKGQVLAGSFTFGPVKLGALTQKVKSSGRTDRKASTIAATYTVGKSEFIAQFGRNKDGGLSGAAAQPETKMESLGYNYNFSKRTTFMARYANVKNNASAARELNGAQLTLNGNDADPKGFGMGFRHTF